MSAKTEVLGAVIEAWCQRKDIDAVISHLTEDVEWHFAAVSAPPVIGHKGAREFLTTYGAKVKRADWRIFQCAESANALFVEGVDEFETMTGGVTIVPYMGVLEFRGDKISAWRDYFDRGWADRSAKGEAMPDHVAKLVNRRALPGLGG